MHVWNTNATKKKSKFNYPDVEKLPMSHILKCGCRLPGGLTVDASTSQVYMEIYMGTKQNFKILKSFEINEIKVVALYYSCQNPLEYA